jgi:hypothetical protein
MSRRAILVVALAALAAATACKKKPRGIGIDVTVGLETDAFHQDPPVTTVTITAFNSARSPIAEAIGAPGGDFSLGEFEPTDFVEVHVTGATAAGDTVMRGRTMGVELGNFAGDTLPVFIERVGQWARPPGQLASARLGGAAAPVAERFLLLTGGSAAAPAGQSYFDMLSLSGFEAGQITREDHTPIVTETLVVVGDAVLFIGPSMPGGKDTAAAWVDFRAGTVRDETAPPELTFAEVAGGAVITNKAGESYVVGATRTGAATDKVLRVSPNQKLSAIKLVNKRRGAAATIVNGVGLVVAGGNLPGATDPLTKGVETLALTDNASAFTTRPFSPDVTFGAAAVPLGSGDQMILVGGTRDGKPAPTRVISSACFTDCDNATNNHVLAADGLGKPLVACGAYQSSLAAALNLIVCSEPKSGEMLTYTLNVAGGVVKPVPLREPRKGATITPTPLGTLALLGGTLLDGSPAQRVELLYPP